MPVPAGTGTRTGRRRQSSCETGTGARPRHPRQGIGAGRPKQHPTAATHTNRRAEPLSWASVPAGTGTRTAGGSPHAGRAPSQGRAIPSRG
ncbi:hypothetical protein B7P02_07070 [Bordetella bronchiseptica]|nr:hypothetical protein B7P02_07070 [Bordetella bronchiseptica]